MANARELAVRVRVGAEEVTVEPTASGANVTVRGHVIHVVVEQGATLMTSVAGRSAPAWRIGDWAGIPGFAEPISRVAPRAGGSRAGALTPPMPATVARILVAVGDVVVEGQPLCVLVAMKTEVTLRSPRAGTVAALPFPAGASVRPGDQLVEFTSSS